MTTLQKTLVAAVVAVLAGAGIYEAKQAHDVRAGAQKSQQQQAMLVGQVDQLQSWFVEATNRLAGLLSENQRLQSNTNQSELLKLRGEMGKLRQMMQALPSARADLLRQKLAQMPDKKIPELIFLTDKDWINAVWNADLDTDDGVRLALSKLRDEAVDTFLSLTRTALKKYLAANDDVLPANLLALKTYYDTPVTDDMLQRYEFMQSGKIDDDHSKSVVRKSVYADPDYDSNQEMSLAGGGGGSFNRVHDDIYAAETGFAIDHNGQVPDDPSQIASYLKRPVDAAALQKYFSPIAADLAAHGPPANIAAWLTQALKSYIAANGKPPRHPADLLPYVATPEQRAQLETMEKEEPVRK